MGADCERHGVGELSPVEGDWGGEAGPEAGAAQPPEGEGARQGPAAGVRPVPAPGHSPQPCPVSSMCSRFDPCDVRPRTVYGCLSQYQLSMSSRLCCVGFSKQ